MRSARFSLQTMPVEEYPSLPDMPAAAGTVPSDVFAAAVSQAVVAAGRDDMLPVLTGVRIEIEGDSISLLATDRFRLAHRELALGAGDDRRPPRPRSSRRRCSPTPPSRSPPATR